MRRLWWRMVKYRVGSAAHRLRRHETLRRLGGQPYQPAYRADGLLKGGIPIAVVVVIVAPLVSVSPLSTVLWLCLGIAAMFWESFDPIHQLREERYRQQWARTRRRELPRQTRRPGITRVRKHVAEMRKRAAALRMRATLQKRRRLANWVIIKKNDGKET